MKPQQPSTDMRKRHEEVNDFANTCSVCATEGDHSNTCEYYRSSTREKRTTLCLCINCEQECLSDLDLKPFDSDTLPDELFDKVDEWAKRASVLSFCYEPHHGPQINHHSDIRAFFEALTELFGDRWQVSATFAPLASSIGLFGSDALHLDEAMQRCIEVGTHTSKDSDLLTLRREVLKSAGIVTEPAVSTPDPMRKDFPPDSATVARLWLIAKWVRNSQGKSAEEREELLGWAVKEANEIFGPITDDEPPVEGGKCTCPSVACALHGLPPGSACGGW